MIHFNGLVGNPPYQGSGQKQIYPEFYKTAKDVADNVCLIFPSKWQEPANKPGVGMKYMYEPETRCDKQIVSITNLDASEVFTGVQGVRKGVNILLWSKGYDNELSGKQRIIAKKGDKVSEEVTDLLKTNHVPDIEELIEKVITSPDFQSCQDVVSKRLPYGLTTDAFTKFNTDFSLEPTSENRITVYGGEPITGKRTKRYLKTQNNILSIRKKSCAAPVESYKIFYPDLWGDTSDKRWIGGTFSDVIIGIPGDVCTEKYHTAFPSDDLDIAIKSSKYLMTRFLRALVSCGKTSPHTPQAAFKNVPVQDFSEDFWDSDNIDDIDNGLLKKYGVSEGMKSYLFEHVQGKGIDNIINYKKVK